MRSVALAVVALLAATELAAQAKPRARDLGVPFDGTPGPNNAITDVGNVRSATRRSFGAMASWWWGRARCAPASRRCCRAGKDAKHPVFAAWFSLNGNGEMTGTTWVEESGSWPVRS